MYNTQKQYLTSVEVPQKTTTYKPISHTELIDLTLGGIEKAGFKLGKESYTTAKDGNVANGLYTIENIKDNEMQLQIGWQNSYDKTLSLKFAIGAHVFICSNGIVRGDMGTFKRKHTGDVQEFTPYTIIENIKSVGETFEKIQSERELLKTLEVDKRTVAELVGRMIVEEEFIRSSQLNIIRSEIKHPSYEYRSEGSLWELYQHTTHSLKETHPSMWMKNHISAHDFFIGAYNELSLESSPKINIPLELNENNEYGIDHERQLKLFSEVN